MEASTPLHDNRCKYRDRKKLKIRPAKKKRSVSPDPASYFPNYSSIYPTPILTNLHKDSKSQIKIKDATIQDIVTAFETKTRDFTFDQVHPLNPRFKTTDDIPHFKNNLKFELQSKRPDIVNPIPSNPSYASYNPSPKKPQIKGMPFESQLTRTFDVHCLQHFDYHLKAMKELDKLQKNPGGAVPFDRQSSRLTLPKKNPKVTFLENLTESHDKLFEEVFYGKKEKSDQQSLKD